MNKRQWKKKQGKYLPLFPDEYNLVAMTDAERKQAIDDFMAYREKYAFRKRYKDLKNDSKNGNILFYSYPVGATYAAIMKKMRDARLPRTNLEPIIVVQTLADLEAFYGTKEI
ncbi:hypothetical protein HCA69_15640 [Listeria grandensis]|uniref:Uncharacterized protein n=1 Tax=Listeria grandensis TaxID=1494963 RepID=A0A7X0Y7F2_9LIST|nr:hypothetical protein [Listeria grandensis]MBC1937802.1 hypothetical protein [Listeria grandensis]